MALVNDPPPQNVFYVSQGTACTPIRYVCVCRKQQNREDPSLQKSAIFFMTEIQIRGKFGLPESLRQRGGESFGCCGMPNEDTEVRDTVFERKAESLMIAMAATGR